MDVAPHLLPCRVQWLGMVPYQEAWDLQRRLAALRQAGQDLDTLLLLEHPPTYTLGRTADPADILLDAAALARRGISVYKVDRGGDVTYHGPGQLVGYPILSLGRGPWSRNVGNYVRLLEEVLIQALASFGVEGQRREGYPGVWADEDKIAALGVRMSRWVSTHGFALNVNTDLDYFRHIVPCGIRDKGVTSLARLLGRPVAMKEVVAAVTRGFCDVFGFEAV